MTLIQLAKENAKIANSIMIVNSFLFIILFITFFSSIVALISGNIIGGFIILAIAILIGLLFFSVLSFLGTDLTEKDLEDFKKL